MPETGEVLVIGIDVWVFVLVAVAVPALVIAIRRFRR
jgi:hypothetical protein